MKTRHLLIVTLSRFLCKIGILKSKTGGMASILYSIFVSSFYQPFRSMISFILNQDFFFEGGGEGCWESSTIVLSTLPLKKDFLIARSTLRFPLKKDNLIARLSSFLQQRLAVKSITAFGENGHE